MLLANRCKCREVTHANGVLVLMAQEMLEQVEQANNPVVGPGAQGSDKDLKRQETFPDKAGGTVRMDPVRKEGADESLGILGADEGERSENEKGGELPKELTMSKKLQCSRL